MRTQFKDANDFGQFCRLILQTLRCCCRFFYQRSILLCHAVHFDDRVVHFFNTNTLFLARCCDFRNDVCHMFDTANHLVNRDTSLSNEFSTDFNFFNRCVDQCFDFFRRSGTTLRQVTHLSRNHGKTTTLLTCTGCFDSSIQRQNVSLESDTVNHANDIDDFLRRFVNGTHGINHLRHHRTTLTRYFRCRRG